MIDPLASAAAAGHSSSPALSRPHAAWRASILCALLAFAIAPMFLAGPIPAMVDYPNHLARMSILARAGTPDANPFYQTAWQFVPNLAMDLIVPPLARWIGVEAAGLAFLVASQILLVGGAVALDWAVKGRLAFAGYVAILFLYATPFAWGFVNFAFGLGLALFALAAWIRLAASGLAASGLATRAACHAGACLILFASHLFALGLYGWAVGLYELWRWRRAGEPMIRRAAILAILALPPAALLLLSRASGATVGGELTLWHASSKGMSLLSLNGFSWTASMAIAPIAFALYVLWRRGDVRLAGAGPLLALGFLALFLAMPHRLFDTEFVDVRVFVAAILVLPAFTDVRPLPSRLRFAIGTVYALFLAINLGVVAAVQLSYRGDYAALKDSFRQLPHGARVLVAQAGVEEDPPSDLSAYPMYQAPVLAAHAANAFAASLFVYPGKQPLVPAPAVRRLAPGQAGPVPLAILADIAAGRAEDQIARAPHLRTWLDDFDTLYVLRAPGLQLPPFLPDRLTPVASGGRFVMYRAIRPAVPGRPETIFQP